jgi:hypothetical protein
MKLFLLSETNFYLFLFTKLLLENAILKKTFTRSKLSCWVRDRRKKISENLVDDAIANKLIFSLFLNIARIKNIYK